MAMDLTTRCSRTAAEALRHGLAVAADPRAAYRAGALLVRGAPLLTGWIAGWLTAEFPPHVLTGHALARATPPWVGRVGTSLAAQRADRVFAEALEDALGAGYREGVHHPIADRPPSPSWGGLLQAGGGRRRYAVHTSDIAYGPGGRDHHLDIWRHPDLPVTGRAPVLVQIPGGAWTVNDKRGQAYPLMSRMAELGWICVPINYGKSPRNTWPAHIVDVKRALAWVRDNIADYGGDPDFIAVTGGSAGAHLASLAALTGNDPRFQPGFEESDTTVAAAAPFYGVYDLTEVETMHEMMLPFLESFVMQTRYADDPELFASASPISHAHGGAPPFFVLHGENDSVIPSAQAQDFCVALRRAGAPVVCYAEVPNAHHAFDIVATVRSLLAADAVADFLGVVFGRYVGSGRALSHTAATNPAG